MQRKMKMEVDDKRSRSEIFLDNVNKYIKSSNFTQSQVADKLNISDSMLSKKMKNNGSTFTLEELYNLAQLLNVSVDDLFTTNKEKIEKQIHLDKNYKPITAQKIENIKILMPIFKKPRVLVFLPLLLSLLCIILLFFLSNNSAYWCLITLAIPLLSIVDYSKSIEQKSFSINYLDDIYYMLETPKFKKFKLVILLHIGELLLIVISLIILLFKLAYIELSNYSLALTICVLLFSLYSTSNIIFLVGSRLKNFKKKIYDFDIDSYKNAYYNFLINTAVFSTSIVITAISIKDGWIVSTICFLSSIFSLMEFILISKKYSEYDLYYEEHECKARKLFPDKYFD